MTNYHEILVAIDGSKNANKAFEEAISAAVQHDANLYIAWVINEEELSNSSFAYSKVLKEEQEKVEKEITHRVKTARDAGVKEVTPVVLQGDPKEVLAKDLPDKYNIDLLVVGATGKGSITREKVGTTVQYVVNNGSCNVLVVR